MLVKILSALTSLVSGPAVSQLAAAYRARQEAQTDKAKLAADERVKTLEAQARVHGGLESLARAVIALPFILYLWKIIIFDKILKAGVTDPLSSELWNVFYIILGFYFLRMTVSKLAR